MDKTNVHAAIRDVEDSLKRAKDGIGRDLADEGHRSYARQQLTRVVQAGLRAVKALSPRGMDALDESVVGAALEVMEGRDKKGPAPKEEKKVDKPAHHPG